MTGAETVLGSSAAMWLSTYGYWILIPTMLFEGTTFGFIAGALSSVGVLNPFVVFGVYVGVRLFTDTFVLILAWWGSDYLERFEFARNIMTKLRNDSGEQTDLAKFIDKHFFESLFLAKVLPVPTLDTALIIAAGTIKIKVKRVYFAILAGQPLWSAMIIGLGYFFGDSIQNPDKVINIIGFAIGLIIVFVVLYNKYGRNWLLEKTYLGQLIQNGRE
ncbi:MAG: hypothetical protein WDZ70_02410 [Candidatus Paceibacterota bacterium]